MAEKYTALRVEKGGYNPNTQEQNWHVYYEATSRSSYMTVAAIDELDAYKKAHKMIAGFGKMAKTLRKNNQARREEFLARGIEPYTEINLEVFNRPETCYGCGRKKHDVWFAEVFYYTSTGLRTRTSSEGLSWDRRKDKQKVIDAAREQLAKLRRQYERRLAKEAENVAVSGDAVQGQ